MNRIAVDIDLDDIYYQMNRADKQMMAEWLAESSGGMWAAKMVEMTVELMAESWVDWKADQLVALLADK